MHSPPQHGPVPYVGFAIFYMWEAWVGNPGFQGIPEGWTLLPKNVREQSVEQKNKTETDYIENTTLYA